MEDGREAQLNSSMFEISSRQYLVAWEFYSTHWVSQKQAQELK